MTIETRADLRRYLDSIGADPGRTLADLMQKSRDPRLRMLCAEGLLDRLLPKLKSVEITGDPDKPLQVMTDRVTQAERVARQARIAELEAKRQKGQGDGLSDGSLPS